MYGLAFTMLSARLRRRRPKSWLSKFPSIASVVICAACSAASQSVSLGRVRAADAESVVQQPFRDLNIQRAEIPVVLQEAVHAPYAPPSAPGCEVLNKDILALDAVLGPDVDAEDRDSRSETVSSVVVDAARDASTGWIPFRGVLRRITGAERESRLVVAAVLAGSVRRGYLKGIGRQIGCAVGPAEIMVAAPSANWTRRNRR